MKQTSLFWEPKQKRKRGKKKSGSRAMPRIKSKWRPPKPADWPNLRNEKTISIDTETFDPSLLTHGPGWSRGDGHIVGLSVSISRNHSWYFPIAHEIQPEYNLDKSKVIQWAKDNLEFHKCNKRTVIGANIMYDLGWLREEGVHVSGNFIDVQHAEALLNEHRRYYNLDSLSHQYLGEGKVSNKLYEWLSDYYGGVANDKQRKNIHKAPTTLVGPYAEADAFQPLLIWKKQKRLIREQELERVFSVECRLIPLLLDMRFRGVRVDLNEVEYLRDTFKNKQKKIQKRLNKLAGLEVNVNASASIQKAFDKHSMSYNLTDKGNPSFPAKFLENHPSKIANLVVEVRRLQKLISTFIEGALLDKHVNGRIHCQFNQLKNDKGGTVSGRFSSSDPNLQNIPVRTDEGKMIRSCFKPDEGFKNWFRTDASQIEFRALAHYAVGKGAKKIRKRYRKDPKTDYHQATIDLIRALAGILLGRKPAKGINFGIVYGMGVPLLRSTLGLDEDATTELMDAYHAGVPFVKTTFNEAMRRAQVYGYLTTYLGRRARFDKWEAPYGNTLFDTYEEAYAAVGPRAQRARTHKALNSLLQGTAADFMKMLMLKTYEAGIFDALKGPPQITLHDELDTSCNFEEDREVLLEMKHIQENCIKLRVPLVMDCEVGADWGHCKGVEL